MFVSNEDNKKKQTGNRRVNNKSNTTKNTVNARNNANNVSSKAPVAREISANQTPKREPSSIRQEVAVPKKKKSNGKAIELGIIFVLLVVLILLLLSFCHKDSYEVSFMSDGKEYTSETVRKGNDLEEPEAPTKEGYKFLGWYLDGEKYDFSKEVTEDMKLEAKWQINTYTVTIDDGMGNVTKQEIEYNQKVKEPSVSERKGYHLDGWYVKNNKFDFSKGIKEDITIEARWLENEKVSYRVEHYLMGLDGEYASYDKVDLLSGYKGSTVTPSTRYYPGFKTPQKSSVALADDGSTVVKYYYSRNKYTLTLKGEEGISSLKGKGTYYYGEKVAVDASVEEGFKFAGWSSKVVKGTYTMPASNVTLTAKTNPIEYTIVYTDGVTVKEEKHKYTDVFELAGGDLFQKEYRISYGYGYGSTVDVESPKATYDSWIQDENTTYDLKEKVSKLTTVDGDKITLTLTWSYPTLKTIERDYYDFLGWVDEEGNPVSEINEETPQNLELTATWKVSNNTIVFESNGGSDVTPLTGETGASVTKPTNPTRVGYTFAGWYSDPDLTQEYTFTTIPEEGITVYAKWDIIHYNLTFDESSYGTCDNCEEKTYTVEDEPIQLPTPVKDGYTFAGWVYEVEDDETGDTEEINVGTEFTVRPEDTELKALWSYELVLAPVDGTLVEGKEVPKIIFYYGKDNIIPTGDFYEKEIKVTWKFDEGSQTVDTYHPTVKCWKVGNSCYTPEQTVNNAFTPVNGKVTLEATYEVTIEKLKTGTKTGKVLGEWINEEEEEVEAPLKVSEDTVLTAKWYDEMTLKAFDEKIKATLSDFTTSVNTKTNTIFVEAEESKKATEGLEKLVANIAQLITDATVDEIDFIYGGETFALDTTSTESITSTIKGALNKILGTQDGDLANKTMKDLDGKAISIKVLLGDEYRTSSGSEELTYNLHFGKKAISSNTFNAAAKNIMEGNINSQGTKLEKYVLSVDGSKLTFSFYHGANTVYDTCISAGLKTAFQNLFMIEGIEYVTLTFTNPSGAVMTVDANAENVSEDHWLDFAIGFLDPFEAAIGKDAFKLTNDDLKVFTEKEGALMVEVHTSANYKFGEGFNDVKTDSEDGTQYLSYEIKFAPLQTEAAPATGKGN